MAKKIDTKPKYYIVNVQCGNCLSCFEGYQIAIGQFVGGVGSCENCGIFGSFKAY